MSEADKTFGKCPNCKRKTLMTGINAKENPRLDNGKIACVDCKVTELKTTIIANLRSRNAERD